MEVLAKAIMKAGGGGCQRVWGFMDGTFRGFCRPGGDLQNQRRVYLGHKKGWGLNWQAIVTLDGLIASLTSPFAGPTNDWMMWRSSGCEEALHMTCRECAPFYVYRDPTYLNMYGTLCPFKHPLSC